MAQMNKQWLWAIPVCAAALIMGGCQEKPATQSEKSQTEATRKTATIPLIQAKVVRINIPQKQFCDEQGCTQYDLQTIQTNVQWIDDYFLQRIKKDVPDAFIRQEQTKNTVDTQAGLNENSIFVRFVAQQYNLATFAIQSYNYAAGAAHGMHHEEFVTFDLSTQKRLALTDLLKPGVETQVAEALYDENSVWLQQHSIERSKLQLSDNYYYGANGIVFVYPLYELASYAEGMSELTLPYMVAKDLIKTEYLPVLPEYDTP
ncbi:RsiV family protein [Acinetobacter sp. WZC-1]|uniref:RsiV family protein n=1 Tax=Acinetobacter sp. WZC-1 TaxID=3459034 RepID=UPI00403D9EF4